MVLFGAHPGEILSRLGRAKTSLNCRRDISYAARSRIVDEIFLGFRRRYSVQADSNSYLASL